MISHTVFCFLAILIQLCVHFTRRVSSDTLDAHHHCNFSNVAQNKSVTEAGNDGEKCNTHAAPSGPPSNEHSLGMSSLKCLKMRFGPDAIQALVIKYTGDIYDAAKKGYYGFVQHYLGITSKDSYNPLGDTELLHYASLGGNVNLLKFLIEEEKYFQSDSPHNGEPPLHAAIRGGKLEAVRYFVEMCEHDVNRADANGDTPAHLASVVGLPILKYLVEKGANLNAVNLEGQSVLHESATNGNLETTKYLIEEKHFDPEVKDNYGETPLYAAIRRGKLPIVKYLAGERKANLYVKDDSGKDILHQATFANNLDLLKYVIDDLGMLPHLEEKDLTGCTVVMEAASYAGLPVLKFLIDEKKTNIQTKDEEGLNLLHLAVCRNKFDVVKYLVEEKGFDPKSKTSTGETAIDLAARQIIPGHSAPGQRVKEYLQSKIK